MDETPGTGSFKSGYVALIGAPNAGKSTLMNRLLGQKLAIVSPKAQTTRRRTLGIVHGAGHQLVLLDTPGILDPRYRLQEAMMRTFSQVMQDADIACLLVDVDAGASPAEPPPALVSFRGVRIAVVNKIDRLHAKEAMIPLLDALGSSGLYAEIVPISALTGEGVDRLLELLIARLPEGPPLYPPDQLTEHPERFFVAELIREAVFYLYHEEVPYSVEVEVSEFKERSGAKDYIEAIVYVEQASQKGILIGEKGQAIRRLGENARQSIEEFLGRPVFLQLHVKVAPKWRRDDAALRRWGYRP